MEKKAQVIKNGEGKKLNVTGAEVRFLCSPEHTGKAWSLAECFAPKDAGPPLHEHPWDESYYILEGEVRFTIDKEVVIAKAGDFIYAPGGTPHAFQGASEKPARILFFDAPAHTASFFQEVENEVKEFPRDLAKMPEIGLRHGIRFYR